MRLRQIVPHISSYIDGGNLDPWLSKKTKTKYVSKPHSLAIEQHTRDHDVSGPTEIPAAHQDVREHRGGHSVY